MTVRRVAQALVVPHGFTLCVAGVLTTSVGERGFPGAMAVWLFIVGAGLTFSITLLLTNGHREGVPSSPPIMGSAVFNLTPIGVVPLVWVSSRWIHNADVAFACAGALTVAFYLAALALLIETSSRRSRAS